MCRDCNVLILCTVRPGTAGYVSVYACDAIAGMSVEEDATISDLAAGLGVERRLIEHQFGLASGRISSTICFSAAIQSRCEVVSSSL